MQDRADRSRIMKQWMRGTGRIALVALLAGGPSFARTPGVEAQDPPARGERPEAPLARALTLALGAQPRLGVTIEPVEGDAGAVRVTEVAAGSGAEEAGIREGDLIMALDGAALRAEGSRTAADDLTTRLREKTEGDTVRVTIRRSGESRELPVTLRRVPGASPGVQILRGEGLLQGRDLARLQLDTVRFREGAVRMLAPGTGSPIEVEVARMALTAGGVQITDLNEGLGRYFGRTDGALVLEVTARGPEGLEAGDVIVAIDGRAVSGTTDFRRIYASYRSGEALTFRVWRQGAGVEVASRRP
jgi:S1-C subfamily serine protease